MRLFPLNMCTFIIRTSHTCVCIHREKGGKWNNLARKLPTCVKLGCCVKVPSSIKSRNGWDQGHHHMHVYKHNLAFVCIPLTRHFVLEPFLHLICYLSIVFVRNSPIVFPFPTKIALSNREGEKPMEDREANIAIRMLGFYLSKAFKFRWK